ncbi:EF-hand domain-containing family member B isoform X1 [Syngnathus acus]|uniref:EF-hand domain-containing family member B isoform X1 n=1 Tax=Syngnathus acus TaxID=161584 RepID=UPI001885F167|nr:EF-hand domain-containing family member B isoform X1 [Syngnathus acus]
MEIISQSGVNMSDAMRIAQMPRAGKRVPFRDTVAACFQEIKRAPTPPPVRKYHNSNRPGPGVIRVHPGKADDPKVAEALVHGVCTKASLSAAVTLNPPPLSNFQQKLLEFSEADYALHKTAPLGRSADPTGLPTWYNENTRFGIPSHPDVDIGQIIHPSKTLDQLEKEEQVVHEAYVHSHNSYFVGEQIDRKYNYNKDSCFGIPTPYCTDGRYVGKNLHWFGESTRVYNPNPVWKRSPDSREKLKQQIGNVDNKKRGTKFEVPPNRTFGIVIPQDEYSVGDLIHSGHQPAGKRARGDERQRCLASAVRNRLKQINLQNFPSLLQAFKHYDKKGKGRIDKEDLQEVCRHFKVVVSDAVLDDVLNECDLDRDGFINFLEFANFLNMKKKMPLDRRDQDLVVDSESYKCTISENENQSNLFLSIYSAQFQTDSDKLPGSAPLLKTNNLEPFKTGSSKKTVRTLRRPELLSDRFITSASFIGAAARKPQESDTRIYGIPSVRKDIAAPPIRKISDHVNYGDMTTVMDLLLPSVYGRQGVYRDHFFLPRSKKEIAEIFRNLGENISEETFEEAWKLASTRHPHGEVCVETFRTVLEEIKAL